MQRFDVVVVGGGPAGVTAALRASEFGATVALVERGRMGGTCTNDGCVPTRVLAHTARLLRDAEQHHAYGLVCDRPSLDFAALMAHTQRVVYRIHEKKGLPGHLETAHVTVFEGVGEATFADANSLALPDGRRVSRESRRILGAHVVGEQAVEIVQLVAAGMAANMRVEQLADVELAYPTYAAIVGLAARQVAREMGTLPGSGPWRTLGKLRAAEWERQEAGAGV